MADLNVGRLVAYVALETIEFDRGIARTMARLQTFGLEASKAAGGTLKLDEGLTSVGESGTKASVGIERAGKSATATAAAEQKAAASALRHAQAVTDVSRVMAENVTASAKVQQATLRQTAAEQRLTGALAETGSAEAKLAGETARLASAQASAIGASERLGASQTTMAARAATAGKGLNKYLALPLLVAAGVSVKSALDFQQATNVYVTAAGESQKNLAVVRAGIEKVAVETGTSIKNLTDAEYIAEKAHLRGAAGIAVLAASAKGAREENANLSDVMQAETSIMASYHLKASDAVAVMNALKTGAGSAKVTMEEYASSLSTVIPIASAAGISLEQVLGAESTLTQHGTSAKEATQELANTIRNLQAPNNVAVAAMNQLGISSVNVSKNLGQRGLTGTLQFIESKLPKTGLVYLTTMKQMEAGTADLTAMQSKMSPSLAKLSQGFLDGSVSAKDYRTSFKDLGADGYAQGTQFLSLATKVKGYNDNIKLGTPAQKTMAAELKALFGGAVGLNTALQLGGHNLAGFKARSDAVGRSLHDSSGEVEGWASTQKLAATQASITTAKLHVLGIEAGTYLLPAFDHLVGGLSAAVTGFGNLSHTDKEVIGWSVVTLAALGPILSIGARIGTAGRSLSTFAGASEATAGRVALSMQRITGALAGAGLVYAGTQTGGTAGGIMGLLGGGLTGASIGSFFGPIGTGVGAVAGAVAGLGLSFLHSGNDGKAAAEKQQAAAQKAQRAIQLQAQAVDTLTQSIEADSNAIGKNTRAQVVSDLTKSGALGLAQKSGISPGLVTNAALGKQGARSKLAGQIKAASQSPALIGAGDGELTNLSKLTEKLKAENVIIGDGGKQADIRAEALGKLNLSMRSVSDQTTRYSHSLTTGTVDGRANIKFIHDHVAALDSERVSGKLTDKQYASQIGTLQSQLKQYKFSTGAVKDYIAGFSKLPKSVVTALLADPKIANSAIGAVLRGIGKVPKAHTTQLYATDHTKPTIDPLRTILGGLSSRTIDITANTGAATAALIALQNRLNSVAGGAAGVSVNNARRVLGGNAAGGGVPEGVSAVGEAGPELVIKHGSVAHVLSNLQSKGFLAATGMKAPGFAGGTSPNSVYRVGSGFGFQGQYFGGKTAQKDAYAARSSFYDTAAAARHYAAIQAAAARPAAGRSVLSAASALGHLAGTAGASRADVAGDLHTLDANLRAAGLSKTFVASLAGDNAKILAAVGNRNHAAAVLAKANTALAKAQALMAGDKSSFAGAVTGSFDIATAGADPVTGRITGGGELAQAKQAVTTAKTFYSGITKLGKMKLFPAAYLRSILAAGPTALPQVLGLLGLPHSQLMDLATQENTLASLGAQIGTFGAQRLDGGRVATAQHAVNVDRGAEARAEARVNKAVDRLGEKFVHALNTAHLTAEIGGKPGHLTLLLESDRRKSTAARGQLR